MTPAEEQRAQRAAAARAGCYVESVGARWTPAGPRAFGRTICPDGWAAARLLVALSASDARRPDVQAIARAMRQVFPTPATFAEAIHRMVKGRVRFVREKGELFTGATYTLAVGEGDCDDHARLALAIAWAGGLPARAAFLAKPGATGPVHAVAQLCPDGVCRWAETTVDAAYGEHPFHAARRLGLLSERQDITATEVVTMSESDLPPIPAGFRAKHTDDAVRADRAALTALGYLCAAAMGAVLPADPSAEDFRQAVYRFQRVHGDLVADGLIGPKTRAAMRTAVRRHKIEGLPGIYAPSAPAAPTHTADLTDAFLVEVNRLARDLETEPAYLLEVMHSESTIRPTAKYPGDRSVADPPRNFATGLIGFVGIRLLGFNAIPASPKGASDRERRIADLMNHEAFAALSALEQLKYARKFWWALKGKIKSALWLYQFNFVPLSIQRGTSPDTVIIARGGSGDRYPDHSYGGQEASFYEPNAGVDLDKDGLITVDDLRRFKERQNQGSKRLEEAIERARSLPDAPPSSTPSGGIAGGAAIVLAFGLPAAYAISEALT